MDTDAFIIMWCLFKRPDVSGVVDPQYRNEQNRT